MSYNNISSERLNIYIYIYTHTLGIFNKLPNIIGDSRGKNRFLNDVYVCLCVCVCVCVCVYDLFIYLFWRLWTSSFTSMQLHSSWYGNLHTRLVQCFDNFDHKGEKNKKGTVNREKKKRLQYFLYLNLQSFLQSWSFFPPTHWFSIYIKSGFITQVRAVMKPTSLLLPCVFS